MRKMIPNTSEDTRIVNWKVTFCATGENHESFVDDVHDYVRRILGNRYSIRCYETIYGYQVVSFDFRATEYIHDLILVGIRDLAAEKEYRDIVTVY